MIKFFKTYLIFIVGPCLGFFIVGSFITLHFLLGIAGIILMILSFKIYFKWNEKEFKQDKLDRIRYIASKTKNCTFIKSYNTEFGYIKVYKNKKTGKILEL